jgi:hypothetical protein
MPSQTLADPAAHAAERWVEAPVTYLADLSIKPVTHNPPQGTGAPRRDGNYRRFPVRIHDARARAAAPSLDREGFALVRHDTAVTDFFDDAQIQAVYHAEMERLIKQATGATRVVVFDHTIRVADRAVERGVRAPVPTVHNDYTETSGPQRVRELLGAEADDLLTRRFAEYNVWRPIRGPDVSV